MALKAGYKGIKNNLLNKLKVIPFISVIGDGLALDENGELSATGGGGVSTLSGLTDVNITEVSDGQILQYDSISEKWVNHVNSPDFIFLSVDIYSAASDTVTYTDRSGVKTVTTDTDGHGTASIICFNGDSITFTSSVAKNPSNLSQAYSKTITVGANTTDIYVMPDNALYWYGYESNDVEIVSTENGWSTSSWGQAIQSPTKQTNDYLCDAPQYMVALIGSKTNHLISKIHTIINITKDKGLLITSNSKDLNPSTMTTAGIEQTSPNAVQHYVIDNLNDTYYISVGATNDRTAVVYAFWYE